ncbi:hypothetical protein B0H15DRAFT_932754 [Mycena belliarum]|uniref:Uncharacterized protein n=1 Tax=Mycena belliarum TaxID=1033014 RepID=A0AAD6TWF2_9AGAR|nr:hypothetical protein B0H15DRAFT_932754 [Mycena belliae]
MPTLAKAKSSNLSFAPSYLPVAVFAGGTSGIGQAMAEAFAQQMKGRARIVLLGRNAAAAEAILARLPKPTDDDGWAHEFVPCDATSMAGVRAVCAALRARLPYINFLVMTAGENCMTECWETPEGLDHHLSIRYYSRYMYVKELLPHLVVAKEKGMDAHVLSVQAGGLGLTIPTDDLGLDNARRSTIKMLRGVMLSFAAMKGIMRGGAYGDGLVTHFAAQHPELTFTYTNPGQVTTPMSVYFNLGWLLTPLAWLVTYVVMPLLQKPPEDSAQYMLYALFNSERGVFMRNQYGNLVSSHVCEAAHSTEFDGTAQKVGVRHGEPMKGYGGSDARVKLLIEHTERVLGAIP